MQKISSEKMLSQAHQTGELYGNLKMCACTSAVYTYSSVCAIMSHHRQLRILIAS